MMLITINIVSDICIPMSNMNFVHFLNVFETLTFNIKSCCTCCSQMEVCSQRLGVPMNCIFPLLNYSEQITNDIHTDILILMAATNIVNFANDYVEDQVYNVNQHSE